ncbi:MAG: hypothetical protein J6U37_02340 [Lachnospiraceae bacterium]|nr:hypothetical protein [Lachnospiraceae bacterium]
MEKTGERVIYYHDELNDEFSEAVIEPKFIGDDYDYKGGFLRALGRLFIYEFLAKPLAEIYLAFKYGHVIVNRECLKECKGKSIFLYGNHTNALADPLIPQFVSMNPSVYFIVHKNNVSMPFLGKLVPCLGGLPLPDTFKATKNLHKRIEELVTGKYPHTVTIYPEAHIWPYYTKIRPFTDASFGYPMTFDTPVYAFTNTYQKRMYRKTPRIVTYVDGPFYFDKEKPRKEAKAELRNKVYEAMVRRSSENNVEMIKYIKEDT